MPDPEPPRGPRPQLSEFKGGASDDAKGWLRKFDLLANRYNWTNDDKIFQLSYNLSGAAGTWIASQPAATQQAWPTLRAAFEARFTGSEPALVIQAKLYNRKLLSTETIDDYQSDILSMGNALGRETEQMAASFVQGLPEQMREYVLGTDTHTLDSYTRRAKLYASQHPVVPHLTAQPSLSMAMACPEVSQNLDGIKTELVNAVQESFKALSVRGRGRGRGRFRDSGRFGRQRSGSRERYRRSQSPRRRHSKSPNRRVSFRDENDQDGCWVCGDVEHWARECPNKFQRQSKD